MKDEELVYRNKLISEFTGIGYINMEYNKSYNSLMPVVNVCLSICCDNALSEWENFFYGAFSSTEIKCLYDSVVSFIEFYNESKIKLNHKKNVI